MRTSGNIFSKHKDYSVANNLFEYNDKFQKDHFMEAWKILDKIILNYQGSRKYLKECYQKESDKVKVKLGDFHPDQLDQSDLKRGFLVDKKKYKDGMYNGKYMGYGTGRYAIIPCIYKLEQYYNNDESVRHSLVIISVNKILIEESKATRPKRETYPSWLPFWFTILVYKIDKKIFPYRKSTISCTSIYHYSNKSYIYEEYTDQKISALLGKPIINEFDNEIPIFLQTEHPIYI